MTQRQISKGQIVRSLIILLLFAATSVLLHATSSVTAVPIKKTLAEFPARIGQWRLIDSYLSSSDILEMLGVKDYIQYNYVNSQGDQVNLYIGYYDAVGVTGSYHSPKNCLPGGGWGIAEVKKVPLQGETNRGKPATVAEMLIQNGSEYQVVLYWYQNRGRIIHSEYWEKVYLVLDALFQGRRDGSFVRIMMHVKDGDIQGTEEKAKQFAEQVQVLLQDYLPGATI